MSKELPKPRNRDELVEEIGRVLKGSVVELRRLFDDTLFIFTNRENLGKVVDYLHNKLGGYYKTGVGSDERELRGYFTVYHVITFDDARLDVIVGVSAGRENPWVPSVIKYAPAADWYELEFRDLLGIEPRGRLVERLVLPDDWPEGLYPLRKEFDYKTRPPLESSVSVTRTLTEVETPGIPIGPYHPALHEPEYFELYVEGEKIVDVRYRGFHVHRGIEKLAETRFTYKQIPFLAERICGICGFVHSSCYALVVEKAAGIEVPERAEFIRSIILEVERLHSHLLWLGVAAHILGYDAGFMHAWRIREKVMVLAEYLTGSRKTYGINIIGGVRKDISGEKVPKILKTLDYVKEETKKLADVMFSVPELKARLTGTGVLRRAEARRLSVVGPVARASGLYRDVRKDMPYFAYKHVSFKVPLYTEGDNLARTLVRVEEIFESVSIIEQLLDMMPGGPINLPSYEIEPGRMAVASIEAPRGEDVHFIITGNGKPYRWRVRAPTYQNIPALKVMLRDNYLADAPLTIASIDPCFSCTDRVVVVDVKSRKVRLLNLKPSGGVV